MMNGQFSCHRVTGLAGAVMLSALIFAGCGEHGVSPQIESVEPPALSNDGWQISTLADQGIDPDRIGLLIREITHGDLEEIHTLLIARNGRLVYEGYFHPSSGMDSLHVLNSATKSVVSTLVGIAAKKNLIESVDQTVADFFPEHADVFDADPDKRDIRLSEVLTMSAGLEWDDKHPSEMDTDGRRVLAAADPVRFVLEKPVVAEPGSTFLYSDGLSTLLSAVVRNVSGMEADEFAGLYLFEPLGITRYDWLRMESGLTIGSYGLRLTARGLAKIGQLYLQLGSYQGQQIVDESWVEAAVDPWIESYQAKTWYGFQWWLNGLQNENGTIDNRNDIWVASGYGGQKLFVVPSKALVVVTFGCQGTYECGMSDSVPHLALYNYILRAMD